MSTEPGVREAEEAAAVGAEGNLLGLAAKVVRGLWRVVRGARLPPAAEPPVPSAGARFANRPVLNDAWRPGARGRIDRRRRAAQGA